MKGLLFYFHIIIMTDSLLFCVNIFRNNKLQKVKTCGRVSPVFWESGDVSCRRLGFSVLRCLFSHIPTNCHNIHFIYLKLNVVIIKQTLIHTTLNKSILIYKQIINNPDFLMGFTCVLGD